jgi:hypothetical protein
MGDGVIWNALLLLLHHCNWLGKHQPPEALIESYDSFKSRE